MPGTGPRRTVLRRVGIALGLIAVLALVAVIVWANTPRAAEPGALDAAVADPAVEVRLEPTVELRPVGRVPRRAVVFYPGARVAPEAYVATWAPIVAATDTLVLIPRMPFNLAVFGRSRADGLIADHPEIDAWWVGGHSLGGSMAANWLGGQPEGRVEGLILWASYATRGAGLHERVDIRVLSVSGGRDGLATPEDITDRIETLPDVATFVEIDGMNHAQFGRYGEQRGDLAPTIDDREAQRRLTEAHARFWDHADAVPAQDTTEEAA